MINSAHEIPCAACAKDNNSCCQDVEVYVTVNDVIRISKAGYVNFFSFELPSIIYAPSCNDPSWGKYVFHPDGSRRILLRKEEKKCFFLAENGCLLPLAIRPLVCRIYPYLFTDKEISGISNFCPISRMADSRRILERMGMAVENIKRWHAQLYREIEREEWERVGVRELAAE